MTTTACGIHVLRIHISEAGRVNHYRLPVCSDYKYGGDFGDTNESTLFAGNYRNGFFA